MITKIKVYKSNAFKKHGGLKKNAQTVQGFTVVDVEPYTPQAKEKFITETAQTLKKYYADFSSPYVFTHIKAIEISTGEPVYIFQDVVLNGQDVITSPQSLLKALQ
ncbi:MAG: hypothetical protein ACP5N7_01900 [Candidatus Pacearchaeota archaeon]